MDPVNLAVYWIYASPITALILAIVRKSKPKGIYFAFYTIVALSVPILLDGKLIFINDRKFIPIGFCAIYFLIWYCAFAFKTKKMKFVSIGALGFVHVLLLLGIMLLVWVVGDSFEKAQLQTQVGPIRVYTRQWGNYAHSGVEYIVTKRIRGFQLIEKMVYKQRCGDRTINCLTEYKINDLNKSFEINIFYKNGNKETLIE